MGFYAAHDNGAITALYQDGRSENIPPGVVAVSYKEKEAIRDQPDRYRIVGALVVEDAGFPDRERGREVDLSRLPKGVAAWVKTILAEIDTLRAQVGLVVETDEEKHTKAEGRV